MTAEAQQPGTNPPEDTAKILPPSQLRNIGHLGGGVISLLRRALHIPDPVAEVKMPGPYDHILEGRKTLRTSDFIRDLKKSTHFKEIDSDLVTTEDPVGFIRVVDDKEETYLDALNIARNRSKQNEATSYGLGRIGKNEVVEIVFNWDFMGASAGVVTAEKICRATKLATEKGLDIVVVYCSGGQRQQEGAAALMGMDIAVDAMEEFKEETGKSIISVLVGNVWGGIMASAVLEGDPIIGMAGSNGGFAGGVVIKAGTGETPPAGAQTIENIALTSRNVHMIINTEDELISVLDQRLSASSKNGGVELKVANKREVNGFNFEGTGFNTPLKERRPSKQPRRSDIASFAEITGDPESTFDQFRILRSDARRPDTLFRLQNAFNWYIPFFSSLTTNDEATDGIKVQYPSIVTALAAIDDVRLGGRRWYGVIGHQPSYIKFENGQVQKIPASPTAADLRYGLRKVESFGRSGLSVVSYTDSFGAKPTLGEEAAGQYDAIWDWLKLKRSYPNLTIGYITGLLGSGGGLATTFMRDHVMMLGESDENPYGGGHMYVAEPKSSANIVYTRNAPTEEDIVRTATTARPNARFLLSRGLIDGIIPEPSGGAQNHALDVVLLEREDIILTTLKLAGLDTKELKARGRQRMEDLKPIPIGYLDTPHTSFLQEAIHRFVRS